MFKNLATCSLVAGLIVVGARALLGEEPLRSADGISVQDRPQSAAYEQDGTSVSALQLASESNDRGLDSVLDETCSQDGRGVTEEYSDRRDETGFFVRGWLDQGFTGNTAGPRNGLNGPLQFNDQSNEYLMNQLYLSLGRAVDTEGSEWDIGGQVDLLYGTDYFFTTAIGLETHQNGTPRWNSDHGPRGTGGALYGLAMPQLFAEVFAPIGNGMTVKMGHFYTILGYESVMAPENFFYSHSYSQQYGEPFTQTGVLASYNAERGLTFHAGFTRGWNTWEDPNDTLAFLGGVEWASSDEQTSLAFSLHTGNEDAAGDNNRTAYSLVFTQELTQNLTYILQHDLGVEQNAAPTVGGPVDGRWYSINQYLIYQLSGTTSCGVRVEWFRDENNTRIFTLPPALVDGRNYFDLTAGFNWKPNKHITLRPEIRWDWSDVSSPLLGVGGVYDDFTKKNQLTLAIDLILSL